MTTEKKQKLTPQQKRDLAVSLEANEEILPFLPELLEDLWELGSVPSLYVEMLRPLPLPQEETRVLDLATGKGAVAVALARELGFHVLGVDLFEPFLEEAKKRAGAAGVSHLCRFEREDVHQTVRKARNFDLVLFISAGGLLGDYKRCVGKLRKTVRPGGYLLIDDGFFKKGKKVERPGYDHYASHTETLNFLTAYGDRIVREHIYSDEQSAAINRGYLSWIKSRARGIEKKNPDIAESLRWYIQNQEEECLALESAVCGACWLLQRPV